MISPQKQEMLKYYQLGLTAYKARRWDDAIAAFEKALEILPGDGPSELYLERSKEYRKNPPPPNWDGVFTMTTK